MRHWMAVARDGSVKAGGYECFLMELGAEILSQLNRNLTPTARTIEG